MKKLTLLIVIMLALATMGRAATLGDLKTALQGRRIDLDSARYPDSVLAEFANQSMSLIATVGKAIRAETTLAVDLNVDRLALPVRFNLVQAVIINQDPVEHKGNRKVLSYVAIEEFGKSFQTNTARIQQYSIGVDSILFDRGSPSGFDTVQIYYFRLPPTVTSLTDTLRIPDKYLPLLQEMMLSMCDDRIRITTPLADKTEKRLLFYENALLGRPTDVK